MFKDGKCNQECNNQNCLYDGFDCQGPVGSCLYEQYCLMNYNNGHCDNGCNMVECDWDGLDCDTGKGRLILITGFIIIAFPICPVTVIATVSAYTL